MSTGLRVRAAPPRVGVRGRATAISFTRPSAGNSPGCAWRAIFRQGRFDGPHSSVMLREPEADSANLAFQNPAVQNPAFQADVLRGLGQSSKAIPARWFYDDAGSALFEAITQLPEYYPTRVESGILEASARPGCPHRSPACPSWASSPDRRSAISPPPPRSTCCARCAPPWAKR